MFIYLAALILCLPMALLFFSVPLLAKNRMAAYGGIAIVLALIGYAIVKMGMQTEGVGFRKIPIHPASTEIIGPDTRAEKTAKYRMETDSGFLEIVLEDSDSNQVKYRAEQKINGSMENPGSFRLDGVARRDSSTNRFSHHALEYQVGFIRDTDSLTIEIVDRTTRGRLKSIGTRIPESK